MGSRRHPLDPPPGGVGDCSVVKLVDSVAAFNAASAAVAMDTARASPLRVASAARDISRFATSIGVGMAVTGSAFMGLFPSLAVWAVKAVITYSPRLAVVLQ